MYPKFVIRKSTNSQFYFNLHAVNKEIILTSEMYTTKQNCEKGIASVKTHAPYDKYYNKKTAVNGQQFFTLVASNGEDIGKSEMYNSSQARDNGIEAVKRDAPKAETEDLS